MYVRASIVEQLPDPLTPLFAELIDGSVTRSLATPDEGVPRRRRRPRRGRRTAHGQRLRVLPLQPRRDDPASLLRTPPAFRVLLTNGRAQRPRRAGATTSHPDAISRPWPAGRRGRSLSSSDGELLDGVAELLDAGTEYYTSVQTIIPVAAMS